MNDIKTGEIGELIAVRFLRDKGYKILDGNYRSGFGEIDIIAENGKFIVFVEVKARAENTLISPSEFVTVKKREKIISTSMQYLQKFPTKKQPRYDVIEILTDKPSSFTVKNIKHIENAFEAEGRYATL